MVQKAFLAGITGYDEQYTCARYIPSAVIHKTHNWYTSALVCVLAGSGGCPYFGGIHHEITQYATLFYHAPSYSH